MRSPKKGLSVIVLFSFHISFFFIFTDFIYNVKFSEMLNIEKANEGHHDISEIL